ncbi:MAG: hypothetical protein NT151_02685 [Acidobacteria bacterium]|nr:hypothetical protein [Acidobacteriota bacterium]
MAHCPRCGSHRLRRRRRQALGFVVHLLTGQRKFTCSKCGWKGWKGREDFSGAPASADQHSSVPRSEPKATNPNTFYCSRRFDRHHGGGARLRMRMRRLVGSGRREKPADVVKAALTVLTLLAIIWGGFQACSLL